MSKVKKEKSVSFQVVHHNAAAIDVGSRENWVAIGQEDEQVRDFGVFTEDHHELARWLKSQDIQIVVMESTGIYWKALFLILESHGLKAVVVNPQHVGSLRNKKTDKHDARFMLKIFQAGLLQASFQPSILTNELRTYNRQRKGLLEDMARLETKMQKSLILMNIQLRIVLTDIMGKSGQKIISAILSGQTDAKKLASLADPRVKASQEDIIKALTGHWQEQYLFMLNQYWQQYHMLQKQVNECDKKIADLLKKEIESKGQNDLDYVPKHKKKKNKHNPGFQIDRYLYQLTDGIDLMEVEGISYTTLLTLVTEVGIDLKRDFPSANHFTSWMGLAPNKKVSGGKVLSSKSNKNRNRMALGFRLAANAIGNQRKATPLTLFFKRLAYRKGRTIAICATARKLAIIVYKMLVNKEAYNPERLVDNSKKVRENKIKKIQKIVKELNLKATDLSFALT